jgi:hypothetical protein
VENREKLDLSNSAVSSQIHSGLVVHFGRSARFAETVNQIQNAGQSALRRFSGNNSASSTAAGNLPQRRPGRYQALYCLSIKFSVRAPHSHRLRRYLDHWRAPDANKRSALGNPCGHRWQSRNQMSINHAIIPSSELPRARACLLYLQTSKTRSQM